MGASGALGRILLMWDRCVVEKIDECVRRYTVACSLRNTDDNFVLGGGDLRAFLAASLPFPFIFPKCRE
jgi:hypothetical protein